MGFKMLSFVCRGRKPIAFHSAPHMYGYVRKWLNATDDRKAGSKDSHPTNNRDHNWMLSWVRFTYVPDSTYFLMVYFSITAQQHCSSWRLPTLHSALLPSGTPSVLSRPSSLASFSLGQYQHSSLHYTKNILSYVHTVVLFTSINTRLFYFVSLQSL